MGWLGLLRALTVRSRFGLCARFRGSCWERMPATGSVSPRTVRLRPSLRFDYRDDFGVSSLTMCSWLRSEP